MKTKGRPQSKNIEDRRNTPKIIGPYESNFVKDSMQRAQQSTKKQAWNSFVKTNYK